MNESSRTIDEVKGNLDGEGGEELGLFPLTLSVVQNCLTSVPLSFTPDIGPHLGTEIQIRLGETLELALTSVRDLDNGRAHPVSVCTRD